MKHKIFLSTLLSLTTMLFLSVLTTTQAQAQTNSFGGRAISINATIAGVNAVLNDTGQLPATGGFITNSLESGNVLGGALTTGPLDATTQAAFDQSRSQAIVQGLNLNVGGNTITSDLVPVSSQCTCPDTGPPVCAGGVMIDNLRINGVFIPIAGVNQTINLASGGTIVINEQIRTGSGNSAGITINGVHVVIPAVADIIISSAHSDIVCGIISGPNNTFSGRAISLNANINGTNAVLADTGELPANGGIIIRSLVSGNLFGGTLTTGALDAITQAGFIQSRSQAIVENLILNVGGNAFTAALVPASSQCTCVESGPPVCDGGVMIDNLRINGVFIPIAGVNQTVNLPTGGTVLINEQIRTGAGNAASLTVNGVHVQIPAVSPGTPPVADVIISSAHSDIVCGSAPASSVSVSGRVLTSTGRGVYNAIVTLTNSSGVVRSTVTNPFGYYRFVEVAVGETYTVRIRSKRYNFMPQIISPNNEITELNFVAQQQ